MPPQSNKFIVFLGLISACLLANQVNAATYSCPPALGAPNVAGFELWHDSQAIKAVYKGVALYDGHPGGMADLEPDNGDGAKSKYDWTLYNNPDGFWMSCLYKGSDMHYIKRLDDPKQFCNIKRKTTLECK